MLRRISLLLSLVLCALLSLESQDNFYIDRDIEKAYQLVSSLQLDQARTVIKKIKQEHPENYLVYHIENYVDFFQIFINEEKEDFKRLEENKDRRIEIIRSGNVDDPFRLFCEAEINLQWSLARLKFDEKLNAAQEMYRAYGLLSENKKRFPEFPYNDKSLSVIHVLAQSIPSIIRKLFSIEGSISKGTQEIAQLYQRSRTEELLFEDEIVVIYAYILFYQNNQREEAWQILKNEYNNKKISSPLISFIMANMGQKMGKTEDAIALLQNRPDGAGYLPFHYLDFLIGKFKLYNLDNDANLYIERFLTSFTGRHYIKEGYQKLAWYHLLIKDDLAAYKKYMSNLKKHGEDLVDEDKQAQKEAKSSEIPHPDLLTARLLYDGGYYNKAYNYLIKKSYVFHDEEELLEYNYRMGRITQALKNYPDAIGYFSHTLNTGKKKSHYLCNAALQIGLILEEQGNLAQAKKYLDKCLDLSPDEYKTSLHQKAKSAKIRIEEQLDKP